MASKLFFLAFILIISFQNSYSQEDSTAKFSIGITLGAKIGNHLANIPVDYENPQIGDFYNLSTNNNYISYGISMNYSFPYFDDDLSIICRLFYENFYSDCWHRTSYYENTITLNNQEKKAFISFINSLDVKYYLFSADILLKYNLIGSLGITLGTSLGYVVNNNFFQKYIIADPDSIKFSDIKDWSQYEMSSNAQSNVDIIYDGKIKNAYDFRIGFLLGIQYEFKIDKFWIVPNIYYNIPLTKVRNNDNDENEDWKLRIIRACIDFRYEL
jgi:hypothetical protein